ncbi:unnamed protein product [Pseudo-nitzschia multistriata]|uniref:AAA+ ATPase domain-containing protein n=1 Tax=Pseudo-nitzschia multistriata TaxID=183589 RepID=A0A448YYI2_9STRA|nr:unnamed protein product [Pseudo-nitzschia multistriata]
MPEDGNANDRKTTPANDSRPGNNSEVAVVLLSGLPASGKSTLAKSLEARYNRCAGDADEPGRRLIHIEYDELEDSLLPPNGDAEESNDTASRRRDAWNRARESALERMERELRTLGNERGLPPSPLPPDGSGGALASHVVLMDDNFHLRGMRKQIHRLLLGYRPIRFGILHLDTPLEVCLERNRNRSGRRRVPDDVIVKMATVLEPPRAAWEAGSAMTIVGGSGEDPGEGKTLEDIVRFLEQCPAIVEVPPEAPIDPEQLAADRARTRESRVHNLDRLLRACVGTVARFDKRRAGAANAARKKLMEDFRAGCIDFATVDSGDGGVADAFLDLVVPMEPPDANTNANTADADSTNPEEYGSDAHAPSTKRSQLGELLNEIKIQ